MRVLDLFSGIGGFSLGLERAGMETVAFCEYDEKCRQVLTKHWPDVPQYNDVRTLTGEQLEQDGITVDIICGGFPCQPFSVAGQQKGEDDDRHLWPEVFRLVKEIRPTYCLLENVAGHINLGLDIVLADLESAGYQQQVFLIPACAVDAKHRRDRVWIVAYTKKLQRDGGGEYWESGKRQISESGKRGSSEDVADTNSERRRSGNAGREDAKDVRQSSGHQGFDSSGLGSWLPEPNVGRVANGVPGRVDRLKQLGNAVVPQVVEIIGRAIMESSK